MLAALVDSGSDFAWYGGNGSHWTIIPLGLTEEAWTSICSWSWPEAPSEHDLPFTGGIVGTVPYEMFSPFPDTQGPVVFRADGALLIENNTGRLLVTAAEGSDLATIRAQALSLLSVAKRLTHTTLPNITLVPSSTDAAYEHLVECALEDIRCGRFYQINLLRYFKVPELDAKGLAKLLAARGGPYSSWVRNRVRDIVSFSPEQFVSVRHTETGWKATTSPIKGTTARNADPHLDAMAANELLASRKNLAELHMIIDLMRNDLNRICSPGSVAVLDSATLRSFINVHHLVGRVEGILQRDLSLQNFLRAMLPAGSITGAPKIEVMKAIREYENRERQYFMGNAFLLDTGGRFDSSVLIRTVTGSRGKDYEFSAGSGIVMSSDPRSERLEIEAKCNVLTPEGQSRWQ